MTALILTLVVLLISVQIESHISSYGYFLPKEVENELLNLDTSKLCLNRFNNEILGVTNDGWFIAHTIYSITCKYYYYGGKNKVYSIPLWSRLHKKIKEYYIIAENNYNGKN